MNIAKRYRQMIYAGAICLAIIAATILVGVNPMTQATTDANLATDQNNALLNVEIARLNHLLMLTRNKMTVDAQLAAQEYAMPEEARVSELVDSLNNAANANGLVVTSLTVGDPEKYVIPPVIHREQDMVAFLATASSSVKDIPVTLSVDGKFSALFSFLNDVQNGERITLVRGIQLQPGATAGMYTLQIQAYVFIVTRK
jgi:Tfp pilus assembly protein PilO